MVEQGTHKPLVGSSTLPPGIYLWLGFISLRIRRAGTILGQLSTLMLDCATSAGSHGATKRLGEKLEIIAKQEVATLKEARRIERELKRKKNPKLAIFYLQHL